jgi:hypothetical protein
MLGRAWQGGSGGRRGEHGAAGRGEGGDAERGAVTVTRMRMVEDGGGA